MTGQKLTLLKFPKTPEELVQNRIDGLLDALCTTDQDFVPDVLSMLCAYIEENYEGEYVWQVELKLVEAAMWGKEAVTRVGEDTEC